MKSPEPARIAAVADVAGCAAGGADGAALASFSGPDGVVAAGGVTRSCAFGASATGERAGGCGAATGVAATAGALGGNAAVTVG